jgi:hypothetical protein
MAMLLSTGTPARDTTGTHIIYFRLLSVNFARGIHEEVVRM